MKISNFKFQISKQENVPEGVLSQRGFTLIELIVAAGIFSVFIIVIVGLFGQFVFTQRRDVAEQDLLEDLRLSLETFNREARTAYGDTFLSARPDGTSVIFRNQNGACVNYRLQDRRLERAEGGSPSGQCTTGTFQGSGAVYTPLTGSGIVLTRAFFDVQPSEVGEPLTCEGDLTAEQKEERGCKSSGDESSDEKEQQGGDEDDKTAEEKEEELGDVLRSQGFITVVLEAEAEGQTLIPVRVQSTVASRQVIPFPTNL